MITSLSPKACGVPSGFLNALSTQKSNQKSILLPKLRVCRHHHYDFAKRKTIQK